MNPAFMAKYAAIVFTASRVFQKTYELARARMRLTSTLIHRFCPDRNAFTSPEKNNPYGQKNAKSSQYFTTSPKVDNPIAGS